MATSSWYAPMWYTFQYSVTLGAAVSMAPYRAGRSILAQSGENDHDRHLGSAVVSSCSDCPALRAVIPRTTAFSDNVDLLPSSWPGLSPQVRLAGLAALIDAQLGQARVAVPSTSSCGTKTWMPGTGPGMTEERPSCPELERLERRTQRQPRWLRLIKAIPQSSGRCSISSHARMIVVRTLPNEPRV